MKYQYIILEVYGDRKQVILYSKKDKETFLCTYATIEELLSRGYAILGASFSKATNNLVLSRYSKNGTPRRNAYCGEVKRQATISDLLRTPSKASGLSLKPGVTGTFSDGEKSVTGMFIATNTTVGLGYPFATRGNMFITKDKEVTYLGSVLAWSPCSFLPEFNAELLALAMKYREYYKAILPTKPSLYDTYLTMGTVFYNCTPSKMVGFALYGLRISFPYPLSSANKEYVARSERHVLSEEEERQLTLVKKLTASSLGISSSAGLTVVADDVTLKYDYGFCSDIDNFYIDLKFEVQERAFKRYTSDALVLLFEQMLTTLGIIKVMRRVTPVEEKSGKFTCIWVVSK